MYFSGIKNSGDVISWKGAWLCLILVSSFSTLLTPVQILLDGIQRQETILRANIAYGIANALAIWCALYLGLGLYSISVSIFLSNLVLYTFIRKPLLNTTTKLNSIAVEMRIKKTFNEISPLLFKVSIVWGLGFHFFGIVLI
ncbi:hypothetical protein [Photobacterium leiognathi]|uniref:hypothetical protein n=1 Tax=Photobacterium leiognathi TaxID=553611 RepID=UPI002739F70F|nr:hypothetical protein [Photobacterium leiognathi]